MPASKSRPNHINEQDTTHSSTAVDFSIYACPTCRSQLKLMEQALICPACNITYPISDGIPDCVPEKPNWSTSPLLRWAEGRRYRQALIYEWLRWPLVLNLYAGFGSLSFKKMVEAIAAMVKVDKGHILDVACVRGIFSRRVASQSRVVHGIDISMDMLHQGADYVKRHHIPNVHFTRARAEALPFGNAVFDAALSVGALQLFTDPLAVLREISRTMKDGAPLAAMTFVAGHRSLLRFHFLRNLTQRAGVHVFEMATLERYVFEAGFEDFRPQVYDSLILFSARKRRCQ
ncbi:methyltransferase domain-containing protein [Chloroflexota bacterium]